MGDRYYATGVQIGTMLGILNEAGDKDYIIKQVKKILTEIEKKQFVGRIEEWEKKNTKIGIVRYKHALKKVPKSKPGFTVVFKDKVKKKDKIELMESILKNKHIKQIEGAIFLLKDGKRKN